MNPPHIGNKNVSEQSMSSLVVKNDLYTYEITTLIQYFKSPNTPSLTLIPYELWAKVGNNSVLCHYKTHCYKSPRQEAGTKLVDAEGHTLYVGRYIPSAHSTAKLCWRSYGAFHQGNIGGFDLNFHRMELNINVFWTIHDHLCSKKEYTLDQWEGMSLYQQNKEVMKIWDTSCQKTNASSTTMFKRRKSIVVCKIHFLKYITWACYA